MHDHHHQDAQTHVPQVSQAHTAHNAHEGHQVDDFLRKFFISLALTIPILGYSEMVRMIFGTRLPLFVGYEWIVGLLGSIIFFFCGAPFLRGAYRELNVRRPGMMTLIALATSTAYFWSVYAILVGKESLFGELATLITIMLLGHWLEMRAVQGARGALRELAKLLPDTALAVRDGREVPISLTELILRDIVIVKPGAKIPADGEVVSGVSDVNESIITGESKPVLKEKGKEVVAGSTNGDGALTIRVTKIGEHTFLAGVMRLVAEAESSRSKLELLADRAALWLTIIALSLGGLTFFLWSLLGFGFTFSVERLVAVLVVACPHALGLAIPLVASVSTTLAARNGFLVKQRSALEVARTVQTVVFDKTGTLTQGTFSVTSAPSHEALMLAASVEARSEHPIARAVVEEAQRQGITLLEVLDFKRVPGVGAEGMVSGQKIFVGHQNGSEIVVMRDGVEIGFIAVADRVRPESRAAIAELKEMGIFVAMITGDSDDVARAVSQELGIDQYFARVAPGDKAQKIRELQARGSNVAFVGDGVNDAPALTQADLGIAVGAGTNVALESAGIILMRNDPRDIGKIIRLSQKTYRKMTQNLFWATGYNIIAIPLAAGVLYAYGILLDPALSAFFMSFSTIIVALNAVTLKRASTL